MDSIFLCVTLRRNEIESATKETWTLNRCAFASNSHAGPQMHRGWEARCCTQAPRTGSRGSSTAFRWSSKQLTRVKWAWTSSSREPSETARPLHAAGAHQLLHARRFLLCWIRFRVLVFLEAKALHSVWDYAIFPLFPPISAVVLLLL